VFSGARNDESVLEPNKQLLDEAKPKLPGSVDRLGIPEDSTDAWLDPNSPSQNQKQWPTVRSTSTAASNHPNRLDVLFRRVLLRYTSLVVGRFLQDPEPSEPWGHGCRHEPYDPQDVAFNHWCAATNLENVRAQFMLR